MLFRSVSQSRYSRLNYTSQADDDNGEDNIFAEARKYLSCYEKMKETAIYKKTYKFMLYVLSLGLLEGVKIDFDSLNFSQYEANAIKQTHKPGLDMIHCFLETILFICDKGIQYFKTGNSEVFFHSGSSYERWLTKANKLIFDAKFLNNPEPHNVNRFTFLSDLKDVIEKGSAILKFTSGLDKQEKIYLMRILNDLRMIEAEQLTRKAAQMPRKDPFAVLIHGSSSICKSQLKQILFYHYGKCFDLPTTADYMYTRCPTDEYWSGFNSTQWCIVMDDIAFLKPNGEVQEAKEGREGRVVIKVNNLVDEVLIKKLLDAAEAGVKVSLIVRGVCLLEPVTPKQKANIDMRSILGRYLEHSRLFAFGVGDRMQIYLGSADLMVYRDWETNIFQIGRAHV